MWVRCDWPSRHLHLKPQVGSPKFSANSADAESTSYKDTKGLFSVNCRYLRKRKLALLSPNSSVQLPLNWACFYPVTSLLRDQQLLVVMHQALQKKKHVTDSAQIFHSHILKGEQRFLAFAPQLYIQSRDLRDLRGGTLTSWHCKTPPNNPICRAL